MDNIDAVKQKIDNLDLSLVIKKLCLSFDKGGFEWPEDEVGPIAADYRKFLLDAYISKQESKDGRPDIRPPSQLVDIFWHTHILFTKKYHHDCDETLGFYLHHLPEVD